MRRRPAYGARNYYKAPNARPRPARTRAAGDFLNRTPLGAARSFPLDRFARGYRAVSTQFFIRRKTNHRHFLRRAFPLAGESWRRPTKARRTRRNRH